jgi:hypothetical protein
LSNSTGIRITAIGYQAGYSNTGGENTFVGSYAGVFTTGSFNAFLGEQSGQNNTTGTQNATDGYGALYTNTTGNNNSAFGFEALVNTDASDNTALGTIAGSANTTGSSNTFIGFNAQPQVNNLTDATAIGANSVVCASNTMVFGDGGVTAWGFGTCPAGGNIFTINGTTAVLSGAGNWVNASDKNVKENFETLDPTDMLAKIMKLPVTKWNYILEGPEIKHIGPMAQDFQRIFAVGANDRSISTIDPSGIALVGIQELKKENDELKIKVDNLEKEIAEIKALLKK